MSNATIQAVDLSFSRAHYAWWRDRLADGVRLAIQCLWTGAATPRFAKANLQDAHDAGLAIAAYAVVNWSPAAHTIAVANAAAGALWPHLRFLAIDAEEDPTSGDPLATLPTIYDAINQVRAAGLRPVTYSRHSYWLPTYGDVSAGAPVWTAEYNSGPALDAVRYPWGHQPIIGKQHQGSTNVGGVTVDLDTFDAAFIFPTDPPKEEPMQLILFKAEDTNAVFALGANGRKTLVTNTLHLAALLRSGAVRGNKVEEWPANDVRAIPRG